MHVYIYIQALPIGVTNKNAVLQAHESKLESLFSLKRDKFDFRALSLELWKMSHHMGFAVHIYIYMYTYMYTYVHMFKCM